jgi:hypothetical protein
MNGDALALVSLERDLARDGIKPSAPVSQLDLRVLLVQLMEEINGVRDAHDKLQKRVEGMQTKVDHGEKHGLTFRGDWQAAESYSAGAVVRHRGGVFTALLDVTPGKGEPGRQGSRWDRIV